MLLLFFLKKLHFRVQTKNNKILGIQQQWIKNIDKIIIIYNDNQNLQNNGEELEVYLQTTYENILKPESNEIYDLMIEIGKDLQENL
ncbi:hypothetical protein [Borreliella garinii]|uniref:hypothetical protein n=1 Tax=Borreliella garinii TaxID=29519 RepID=UPI000D7C9D1E